MLDDLYNVPSQFMHFTQFTEQLGKVPKQKYKKIVVAGMGGSAFPANVVADYLRIDKVDMAHSLIPQDIIDWRSYDLPANLPKQTLVIASSYSGNTEETVSAAKKALKEGLPLVIMTSGGKLKQLAQKHNLPHITFPADGIQPRLATGYMVAAILAILEKAGILSDQSKVMASTARHVKKAFAHKTKSFALAKKLSGALPIMYADDRFQTLARISKIKCNENSKYPAFYNFLPELNHNEMIGWTTTPVPPHFLVFVDKAMHPRNKKRVEVLTKLFKQKKYPVTHIELQGGNYLQKLFHTLIIVDFITIKLAQIRGIDPKPVPMVEEFKKLL